MAYDNSKEKQEIIGKVKRNDRGEYIQVSRITPNDETKLPSVDIRQMYTTDAGEIKPTSKGVRMNSEVVPDVALAFMRALSVDEFSSIAGFIQDMLDEYYYGNSDDDEDDTDDYVDDIEDDEEGDEESDEGDESDEE